MAPIDRPDAWGYISHSTINIGDDFQSVAARRFLPDGAVPVDREFIAAFTHPSKVKVLVNGWFMHQRGSYWDLPVAPPEKSWPPSPAIDPLFLSIHLTQTFHSTVFSAANAKYLDAHAPIGARDLYTLEALQAHGVPSYLSGCLTLTLPPQPTRRSDRLCLVDLDGPTIDWIRRRARSPIAVMSHGKSMLPFLAPHHRLQYAEYLLGVYRRARCVVTTRLHAALPCLAFGTPVLLLASETPGWLNPRFRGLAEHVRHTSKEELTTGLVEYDFDAPPPNPGTHLPIRDRLVKTMTDWVDGKKVGWADHGAVRPVEERREAHDPPSDGRPGRAAFVTSLIRPGDVGVEIGVQMGAFAYDVLLHCRPSRLYLIDPWQYGLQGDVETDPTPQKQAGRDAEYRSVCERFAPYSNVEILRLKSEDAAARFADRSLDYVYIDGEHSFEAVTRDLTHYFPKVKVGGLLIGDDYGWTGVAPAVQAFLASRLDDVRFLVAPYSEDAAGQFVLRRVR